jgi:hypothetical protein
VQTAKFPEVEDIFGLLERETVLVQRPLDVRCPCEAEPVALLLDREREEAGQMK